MAKHTENDAGLAAAIRGFVQWSITPPQAYAAYFICLVAVLGLSFYAGTLKPKRTTGVVPQSTSLPRN